LARKAKHGRPAGRPIFENYDRWLTPVDRPVDRPKPRVWVCQSIDRPVNRGTCTHANPIGQNYDRSHGWPFWPV